jgi:hypothetical protein
MTTPGREDAARLLASLDPPAWFARHACAVADVAAWLARRTIANGTPVDATLVEAAALVHDLDKLPAAGIRDRLRHGDGSAAWLEAHGLAVLSPLVRDHPVSRFAELAFAQWTATASPEARIVSYADKRAGQRLESMDERFGSWQRRYPAGPVSPRRTGDGPPTGAGWDDETARMVLSRARELERVVCEAAGVHPDEVRRLRWAGRALGRATRETQPTRRAGNPSGEHAA